MKRRLKYLWKYYIKPVLLGIDPNSPRGLELRAKRLEELEKEGKSH